MRLSQLARKISKTPKELLDFFESNGIRKYSSSNVKVNPEHINFVLQHFEKELNSGLPSTSDPADDKYKEDLKTSSGSEIKKMKTPVKTKKTDTEEKPDDVELIRAPKVKLQGVKVVGKIDIPNQALKTKDPAVEKSKQEKSVERSSDNQTYKQGSQSSGVFNKKDPKLRKSTNRITYQEKLRREKQERERTKRKQMREDKERKKKHYQKNVQSKIQQLPAKRKIKSQTKEPETAPIHATPPHYKNPLRRLWAWLNGVYDGY